MFVKRDVQKFSSQTRIIFGEAQLDGRAALISLARLRPDANDKPADEELYRIRALKEAVHEL